MREKNTPLQICNEKIYPGEHLNLALPLPELYSCAPLFMPMKVWHGKSSGPILLVFAALHGSELNGIEIIEKLAQFKALKKINGTLILVPVVNVYGLLDGNQTTFEEHSMLTTEFPGDIKGSHAQRLAHVFLDKIFNLADYAVSLETGPPNFSNLPQVITNLKHDTTHNLAKLFGVPVISNFANRPNSLQAYALKHEKKFLIYRAGEATRVDSSSVKLGVRGITNVMTALNMIPEQHFKASKIIPNMMQDGSVWMRSPCSGIHSSLIKLGQKIGQNEEICKIKDPFGTRGSQTLKSPKEAIVVGINKLPLVHEGSPLYRLALFQDLEKTATHLEAWEKNTSTT